MTAYIDVYSRKIMGWGISNSMSKQWCMDVLEAAITENGVPEIINSDQGSQYTSPSWTNYLEGKGIKISMDGKGRAPETHYSIYRVATKLELLDLLKWMLKKIG